MTGVRAGRLEVGAERGASTERGFVTAETAMVMPTLMGLGLALVLVVTAAATQLRCADAAWEAARGLARGEPADFATRVVDQLGPAGASVSVETVDGSVLVRVSAQLAISGALLPAIHVEGHARVTCEPGTPCAKTAVGEGAR